MAISLPYFVTFTVLIWCLAQKTCADKIRYEPTWESIDSRPLPSWYDEAKIGIFIHYGIWSVSAAGFPESAFLWYYLRNNQSAAVEFVKKNYPKGFQYPDLSSDFKAEFYDPQKWADIFKSSGAKYVVFVSKHHDGFSEWPSAYSFNWNSMDIGPKRDLMGELFNAVRSQNELKIGAYYSLFEFYNNLYLKDRSNNYTTREYIQSKMLPQLKELVNKYKPDVIWADGDWDTDSSYWQSKEFLAWLYSDSPVADNVVVNDRWGNDGLCRHGGYLTCNDRFNPRKLVSRKWENAFTLDLNSWGYRNNFDLKDVITIESLLEEVITTVSCGGNALINVGPRSDGTISPIFEERFRQLGRWLSINGEAIYKTKPWLFQDDSLNDKQVWYTSRLSAFDYINSMLELYAISLKWPKLLKSYDFQTSTISFNTSVVCSKIYSVTMLGYNNTVPDSNQHENIPKFSKANQNNKEAVLKYYCDKSDMYRLKIDLTDVESMKVQSEWAFTFKIYLFF